MPTKTKHTLALDGYESGEYDFLKVLDAKGQTAEFDASIVGERVLSD